MLIAALPKVVLSYTLAVTTSVGNTAVNGFTSAETCSRIRDAAPTRIRGRVRAPGYGCCRYAAGRSMPARTCPSGAADARGTGRRPIDRAGSGHLGQVEVVAGALAP